MPTAGVQKALHQRNKSSPSLSTMLNAGGLKMAAKRTAFGDVSNTANISRPSKDDSVIGAKGDYNALEKTIPAQQDKRTTALLRPAQRPLSLCGSKSLLNVSSQRSVNQPLPEVQQPLQALVQTANTRKGVTKKGSAILKDPAPTQSELPTSDLQRVHTSLTPVVPVHRELPARQQPREADAYQNLQPTQAGKQSKRLSQQEPQERPTVTSATQTLSEEPAASRSDGIYIDEQGQVQSYDYIDPVELAAISHAERSMKSDGEVPKPTSRPCLERISDNHLVKQKSEASQKPMLAPVSEPEEYWDDDGEENYDEEGYVTARSFKSRGDNTTGGATTVLFPKVNQKAKQEIAAAKHLIEGSKTAEELEDEAWDTTMVAEYGEEIFQYMKDLEVCSLGLIMISMPNSLLDQDAPQCPLHGQPSRDPVVNACSFDGLDRPSPSSLQPPSGDLVSLCQLH